MERLRSPRKTSSPATSLTPRLPQRPSIITTKHVGSKLRLFRGVVTRPQTTKMMVRETLKTLGLHCRLVSKEASLLALKNSATNSPRKEDPLRASNLSDTVSPTEEVRHCPDTLADLARTQSAPSPLSQRNKADATKTRRNYLVAY